MKIFILSLALIVSNFAFASTPMDSKTMVQLLLDSKITVKNSGCDDKLTQVSDILNNWLTITTEEYPGFLKASLEPDNSYCLYFETIDPKEKDPENVTQYAESLCFNAVDNKVVDNVVTHICY